MLNQLKTYFQIYKVVMVLGAAVHAQSWKCEEKQSSDCDGCRFLLSSSAISKVVLWTEREIQRELIETQSNEKKCKIWSDYLASSTYKPRYDIHTVIVITVLDAIVVVTVK